MYLLLVLVLNTFALVLTANIMQALGMGFVLDGFASALVAAIVLGIINTFIKPILMFLTAPINLLTLGLFTFIVNAIVLALTASLVPGFHIMNFWPTAVLAAIVLSVVSTVLSTLVKDLKLVSSGKKK